MNNIRLPNIWMKVNTLKVMNHMSIQKASPQTTQTKFWSFKWIRLELVEASIHCWIFTKKIQTRRIKVVGLKWQIINSPDLKKIPTKKKIGRNTEIKGKRDSLATIRLLLKWLFSYWRKSNAKTCHRKCSDD